jgi:hypothetical protein
MKTFLEFESTKDIMSLLNYGSMKELHNWAREGWPPGIEAINDLLSEMSLNIEFKQDIAPAVQGLFFDIGLVCSDIPEHWFTPQPTNRGAFNDSEPLENCTPIQIGINIGNSLHSSFSIERGAAISVLMMYLVERLKRPVILKQYCSLQTADDLFAGSLLIKSHDGPLDINCLSFWVCCSGVADCWKRIMEDIPCLAHLSTAETTCISKPDVEYGKHNTDIFISLNDEKKNWTRKDSITWVSSTIRKFIDDFQNTNEQ